MDHARAPRVQLPFGAGPRTCLGALFANQALRLILAMVLRQFRLRTVEGTRIDRLVRGNIVHPRQGLPMLVERRVGGNDRAPARVRGDIHQLVMLPSAQAKLTRWRRRPAGGRLPPRIGRMETTRSGR